MRLAISTAFVWALLATSCATKNTPNAAFPTEPRERRIRLAQSIPTDTPPGATYEVRVYLVQAGDTFAAVAQRFHLSEQEFLALNPGMRTRQLKVKQRVVVYERTIQ
jgi:LysM repeat protein